MSRLIVMLFSALTLGFCVMGSQFIMPLAQAGYDDGMRAYSQNQYDVALKQFRPLLAKGHSGAEFMVGTMYFHGKGIQSDNGIAAGWFYKAARQGHFGAQLALGSLYIHGRGVQQDIVKAYMWLTLASRSDVAVLHKQAMRLRTEIIVLMSSTEIERALKISESWTSQESGLVWNN